jgi:hypothetical protein
MQLSDFPDQGRPGYVVVNPSMVEDMELPIALRHDEYLIVRDCPFCGQGATTIVPAQGLWAWEHGTFAQFAFPDLTASEREQVMTGTHGGCWDKAFSDEEEDNE